MAIASASSAFPIARWIKGDATNNLKTDAPFQNDLLNALVRVRRNSFYPKNGGREFDAYGSGVVVKTQLDAKANEGYVWVMTADHVVAPRKAIGGNDPQTTIYIGFGNGDTDANKPGLEVQSVTRGPIVDGKQADVAIVRYFADNLLKLPDKLTAIPIVGWDGDKKALVDQAGSGNYAKSVDTSVFEYNLSVNDPGKLRIGLNTIDAAEDTSYDDADTGKSWAFKSLRSDLTFQIGKDDAISADAYFTNGDSGGGTFEKVKDKWGLIGIHSYSEIPSGGNPRDGLKQWDVDVANAAYADWLKKGLQPVPEPASVFVLTATIVALVRRRR
ncbi:MAG: PEP-CTERM sorting domain-containing protein [Armatimonadetes bacterium]|nr:PEP-CTERM sorting domain-containing protein [Armatimonadota bacterium]